MLDKADTATDNVYPYLACIDDIEDYAYNAVVLFISKNTGTLVMQGRSTRDESSYYGAIGEFRTDWSESSFKALSNTAEVNLSN